MSINVEHIPVLSRNWKSVNTEKLDWSVLKKESIYYAHTDKSISYINLPRDVIMCSDAYYKDVKH